MMMQNGQNKPKRIPHTRRDTIDLMFCRVEVLVRVIDVNSHSTGRRVGDWETNVENSWVNPPKNFSEALCLREPQETGR